jgi:two-component system response regulator AtoC
MRRRPFSAPDVRLERWLEFLPLERATGRAPTDEVRDRAKFLVERQSLLRRRIAEGRIPAVLEPALLLPATAFHSGLPSIGLSACAEDVLEGNGCGDGQPGAARHWVTRTPAGVVLPGARSSPEAARDELRRLREMVAVALAGEAPVEGPLPLGISGLSLSAQGEETLRLGRPEPLSGAPEAAILRAGSEEYALRLWPPVCSEVADAVALVVETLLFRPEAVAPPTEFAEGWRRFGVVTADTAMEEPFRRLTRFAPRAMTVLVLGESGSGKEAVARAVHALSPRAGGPFVAVNVSAIPAALVESELFGHARGAFTGAERDRAGLLEEAGRGTIFFDEIGDLAAPLQSKLLRALQDREIRRVGENRARRIDVRVVSATSRDLGCEVEAGRFREDLYYRLHVAVIRLPPLRERGRDALLLARHFLAQCAKEYGRLELELAPDACAAVLAHPWPGNVRELQSAIAQAAALADGRRIAAALLPAVVKRATRAGEFGRGYRARVNAHRRDLIREALDRAGGNRSRAARDLRLSRQALLYLIRELKVEARRV